ncbi:MAG: AbrB/MazE/SpoVT family DNA-binding domain-containing protein [Thermoplasmatales archaeon]|nr:AbrB/MazE/SpoVT family DNA-binding domain-containing protein [Thermoplasmatales archaeon]
MTLKRKTRVSGTSIVVTIPSQIAEAYNINSGDIIEIIPYKNGEIRIKKYNQELTGPKQQN